MGGAAAKQPPAPGMIMGPGLHIYLIPEEASYKAASECVSVFSNNHRVWWRRGEICSRTIVLQRQPIERVGGGRKARDGSNNIPHTVSCTQNLTHPGNSKLQRLP